MSRPSSRAAPNRFALRVADLPQSAPSAFEVLPDAGETEKLRAALQLTGLRKLRMTGELAPLGAQDWHLTAVLGATVVQPCVVTLEPVTTRIDTEAARQYLRDYEEPDAPEAEMPEDDGTEALGAYIDLWQVLLETLSLALPLYPRADGQDAPFEVRVTEPGKAAMSDDEAKPFAGLAGLKSQLMRRDTDEDPEE